MERMIARDRFINIISGHMGAGKTYWFDVITSLQENQGSNVLALSKDKVLAKYFSKRTGGSAGDTSPNHLLAIYEKMTPHERLYADEILRVDVGRAILIDGIERVFLDMSMRSREKYQEPFVAIVKHTEHWMGLFESDKAKKQGLLPPDPLPKVHLRVALLYSNFETIRRRMASRWPHIPVEKLPAPLLETLPNFEMPTVYPFLAIDNSDESTQANHIRMQELRAFFSGQVFDPALMNARAEDARKCIEDSKREIQKFL